MKYQLELDGHPARAVIPKENRLLAIGVYKPTVHYYPLQTCEELSKLKSISKRFNGEVKKTIIVPEKLALILNKNNLLQKEKCFGKSTTAIAIIEEHKELIPEELQPQRKKKKKQTKTFLVEGKKEECFVLKINQ